MEQGPKFEPKIESKKENIQEVDEVKLEDLEKGDKLIVDTIFGKKVSTREITVDKKVKTKDGELKHLIVELKDPGEEELLTAKMSGGLSTPPEEWHYQFLDEGKKGAKPIPKEVRDKVGPTPGIIMNKDNNCLHFYDVNYKNIFEETKSGKRKEFRRRSTRTSPIKKILLVKKEE